MVCAVWCDVMQCGVLRDLPWGVMVCAVWCYCMCCEEWLDMLCGVMVVLWSVMACDVG